MMRHSTLIRVTLPLSASTSLMASPIRVDCLLRVDVPVHGRGGVGVGSSGKTRDASRDRVEERRERGGGELERVLQRCLLVGGAVGRRASQKVRLAALTGRGSAGGETNARPAGVERSDHTGSCFDV